MKPFDEPGNYEYDLINFDNIYNYLWVDIVSCNINYLYFFSDFGRYLPIFGSGGFAAGTPLSTQMIKNEKRKEKTNFKIIKIIIIRKRK